MVGELPIRFTGLGHHQNSYNSGTLEATPAGVNYSRQNSSVGFSCVAIATENKGEQ
jgi:hypothetical protein